MRYLVLSIFLLLPVIAQAALTDAQGIRAVYGEAAGESYIGKLATACALRNRDRLGGVYGYNSAIQHRAIDARAWAECARAWAESRLHDITGGATHWESIRFRKPAWARHMTFCGQFGKQKFYR